MSRKAETQTVTNERVHFQINVHWWHLHKNVRIKSRCLPLEDFKESLKFTERFFLDVLGLFIWI